jgi:hypothetical protein
VTIDNEDGHPIDHKTAWNLDRDDLSVLHTRLHDEKDIESLREQLEEALSIIEDFTEEYGASERTWERIQVLRLKQ